MKASKALLLLAAALLFLAALKVLGWVDPLPAAPALALFGLAAWALSGGLEP